MRVEGVINYDFSFPCWVADGQWITFDCFATLRGSWSTILETGQVFTADDITYNPAHIYDMTRQGTGAPFGLKFNDDYYGDNSGAYTVKLYEVSSVADKPVAPAASAGCKCSTSNTG